MCTIAILLDVVDGLPLVVAANRDEMFARPTRPPESLGAHLAGGVDALSGGTWLAIRDDGGFAAVTNQRVLLPVPSGLRSRGLVVRELAGAADPAAYVAGLDPAHYASMNLAWGDARGVSVAYLRRPASDGVGGAGEHVVERLPAGIHVLCNDRIGAEGFPRGERLAAAIARAPRDWPGMRRALIAALADHTQEEPGPLAAPAHLAPGLARALTATCIHSPAYGTRSSTIFAARAGATVAYDHADGPPCTTAFRDRLELLS
ncbi:MAG TPA: NRDE family protein [Kofleriaceae bacterium]|nr:NRDE family protein [Kofleriaceae bacterium]